VVTAQYLLHLNLNTRDLPTAAHFYEKVLGLRIRMQSAGTDGDWRFHGIEEPVASEAWFLYDDRGPRTSPALEVIEWRRPATGGDSYRSLAHQGISSLRFAVSDLDGVATAVTDAAGEVVGPLGPDALLVRDPDGVFVELVADARASADSGRLLGARVGCADLATSLRWYAQLGFLASGDPEEEVLRVGGVEHRVRRASLALPSASASLELTQWMEPEAEGPAEARLWHRGMVRMAASVESLDATIEALDAAGWNCPTPQSFPMTGTAVGELRVLFLTDPDGLTVELVHRPAASFLPTTSSSTDGGR
jgi:catechol 2,3-dioxygenase-like lactoylglutathione lyase family enzyme